MKSIGGGEKSGSQLTFGIFNLLIDGFCLVSLIFDPISFKRDIKYFLQASMFKYIHIYHGLYIDDTGAF